MKKSFKIFISLCLCLSFLLLTGCGLSSTTTGVENAQELIDSGVLKYPSTNNYFRYNVYSGYVAITQCLSEEKYIEVPAEIDGLPVLGINANAFLDNVHVKTIKLNENLYYIQESAFSGCTALTQINLPQTITEIGADAFYGCTSLKQISIPPNIELISGNLFAECSSLQKIIIEESEDQTISKIIDMSAFYNCKNLSFVWLPNDITEISEDAFEGAPVNLKIYGYAESIAADFCATNLIDFAVLDRNNFDNITILSNKISIPQYKTINNTITSSDWKITLLDYKEYSSIGNIKPNKGNVFLAIYFNVSNLTTSEAYFNLLNTKAVVSGYEKPLTYANITHIDSVPLLTGSVGPLQTINGYLLYEVNENWIYTYVDFVDIAGFEYSENYETRLAVYPKETL